MLTAQDAHDVILHLTFSHTLGLMDAGGDIDGFISKLDGNLNSLALVRSSGASVPLILDTRY